MRKRWYLRYRGRQGATLAIHQRRVPCKVLGGNRVWSGCIIWALTFASAAAPLRELSRILVLVLRLVVNVAGRLLRQSVPAHGARGDVELPAPAPRRLLNRCTRLSVKCRCRGLGGVLALESQCINLSDAQLVS